MIQLWMMQQWQRLSGYTLTIGLAIAMASTFMACSVNPPGLSPDPQVRIHQMLNTAPHVAITDSNRRTVYDEPGKFQVLHGYSCAQASRAATSDTLGLRVRETVQFPSRAYEGTVFLNGWNAEYLGSNDHEVFGLGSVIFNITRVSNFPYLTLYWEAGGVLSDKNGDDPYHNGVTTTR